jgi:hypothetical protein
VRISSTVRTWVSESIAKKHPVVADAQAVQIAADEALHVNVRRIARRGGLDPCDYLHPAIRWKPSQCLSCTGGEDDLQ